MAPPRPWRTSSVTNIDPSRFRLIPELTPGPLGYKDASDQILGQGLSLQVAVPPPHNLHLLSKQDWEEMLAEPEFKLLVGHISDNTVKKYVERRNRVFGSTPLYDMFAAISDQELEDNPSLRMQIEMGENYGKERKSLPLNRWSQREIKRQNVFYRWVRKAYLDAGVKDVPALIKAGTSERLQKALAEVKASYVGTFKAQDALNPRPVKDANYRYVLGTLSDHALGIAVDVEPARNPILSREEWRFLENFTGKRVDRSPARWKTKPEDLWKDITEVNNLFVAKLPEAVKNMDQQIQWAKTKNAIETGVQLSPPSLTASHGKEYHLTDKTLSLSKTTMEMQNRTALDWVLAGVSRLKDFQKGFFTLDWALVKELHAHDFIWGATISNKVDLHHFEL